MEILILFIVVPIILSLILSRKKSYNYTFIEITDIHFNKPSQGVYIPSGAIVLNQSIGEYIIEGLENHSILKSFKRSDLKLSKRDFYQLKKGDRLEIKIDKKGKIDNCYISKNTESKILKIKLE